MLYVRPGDAGGLAARLTEPLPRLVRLIEPTRARQAKPNKWARNTVFRKTKYNTIDLYSVCMQCVTNYDSIYGTNQVAPVMHGVRDHRPVHCNT